MPDGARPQGAPDVARSGRGPTRSVAASIGLGAGWLARTTRRGDGVQIAGRVMLRLSPSIGRRLAAGRRVVLISATNGKTSTSAMLAAALRAGGEVVAHNASGANLMPGLVAALAAAPNATTAVLETDEGALIQALRDLAPTVVVLGELSRDQLDRYHEVRALAQRWQGALSGTRATVVAVANDPNVAWSVEGVETVRWVDLQLPARLDTASCPACARLLEHAASGWRCHGCGRVQPTAITTVQRSNQVAINGTTIGLDLGLMGAWQYANAALALTAVDALGLEPRAASVAMASVREVANRPTRVALDGTHHAETVLVKNPAGWTALVAELAGREPDVGVVVVQNDRTADGRDPSFLWDVPFESFAGRRVGAAGTRAYDVATRLDLAGADVVAVDADPLVVARRLASAGPVVIAASYTSFYEMVRRVARGRGRRANGSSAGVQHHVAASVSSDARRPSMATRDSEIAIGLIYPELLGTYGDRGNAVVLRERLRRRGIAARVVEVAADDAVPSGLDCYLLGGGEDLAEIAALDRLEHAGLRDAWTRGAVVVGVCAGLQLLGSRVLLEGTLRDGLGFFEATTEPGPARCVGEVAIDASDPTLGVLTGFENHQGITAVGGSARPLGVHGDGREEGILGERLIGTYLHGPILVRNPLLADRVLTWMVGPLAPLDDGFEDKLHGARLRAVARAKGASRTNRLRGRLREQLQ